MMTLFNLGKWIGSSGSNKDSQHGSAATSKQSGISQVREMAQLISDGPPRPDGSDKFFGMENVVNGEKFGNTCYCNSILQCLYFSKAFREAVINYPHRTMIRSENLLTSSSSALKHANGTVVGGPRADLARINTDPTANLAGSLALAKGKSPLSPTSPKDDGKRKPLPMVAQIQQVPGQPNRAEDTPEAKKKAALLVGPVLRIDTGYNHEYGMRDTLFTSLKDIFEAIVLHDSRTGVVSPMKFVEILKRDNELFRSSLHQDAHEFLNFVLNEVIENVEEYQKKLASSKQANGSASKATAESSTPPANGAPGANGVSTPTPDDSAAQSTLTLTAANATPSAGWIHDLFEGLLTSETKCLTCENISRRDEAFLDLSIDLEKYTSVTACLRNFSASEMLCERNKFHCDCCGGLQEAEKRMKIKRLPRILALHLKRFKYNEDIGRHAKLFHKVMFPYHLRLFNTTDDAEDPDRLYELYAVVVHIGGGPYHGHYVAIVKTEDKGWFLFDDELVEPVGKDYVRNFFGGDEKRLACAYVLFYQETTFEKMQREMYGDDEPTQDSESKAHTRDSKLENIEERRPLASTKASPFSFPSSIGTSVSSSTAEIIAPNPRAPGAMAAEHTAPTAIKSKKEMGREKKDAKAAAKLAAKLEKGERLAEELKDKGHHQPRSNLFSRGLRASPSGWFAKDKKEDKEKNKDKERKGNENGALLAHEEQAVLRPTSENSNSNAEEEKPKEEDLEKPGSAEGISKESPGPLSPNNNLTKEKEKKKGRFGLAGLRRKTSVLLPNNENTTRAKEKHSVADPIKPVEVSVLKESSDISAQATAQQKVNDK